MKAYKKFTVVLVFLMSINALVYSQNLFVENFNYPAGGDLNEHGNWYESGGYGPYKIKIAPGLSYPGYLSSGIGNGLYVQNRDSGESLLHQIAPISSGNIYMSFLIRVDSIFGSGFHICFDQSGAATNFSSRLYLDDVTSSTFKFGILKKLNPSVYSSNIYTTNTTYLIVIKYSFIAGADNDSAKLFVFSAGVPATEPTTPTVASTIGSDVVDIGEVQIRNKNLGAGLGNTSLKYDGLRIGTTWANTLLTNVTSNLTFTGLIQGFYNNVTNKIAKDTARIYVRHRYSPYTIVDSSKAFFDSTGKGNFIFNTVTNNVSYLIAFKHRNSIETWTEYGHQFGSNVLNLNFTTSAALAYGDNLILKGSKYCIYNGDVNQDGFVDLTDISNIYNGANNFLSGYVKQDLTGDNYVDLSDLALAYNNSSNFVSRILP